jgi:hypothetical protein
MRSNSSGELYPFFGDPRIHSSMALSVTHDLWHRRLNHLNSKALFHLPLEFLSHCNNGKKKISFCDAYQLGEQVDLPFSTSHSRH